MSNKDQDFTQKWIARVEKAEKRLKDKHREWAKRAEEHYYNDKTDIEVPIYHSMVEVQSSALYAQPPNPDIRGRDNLQINELSRTISKLLEKAISYNIDQSEFHNDASRAVKDFILVDLGVARIRLDTKTDVQQDMYGQPILDEVTEEPMEMVTYQHCFIDHWPWERFIYDMGKDWGECDWICYLHYMTPAETWKEYKWKPSNSQIDSADHSDTKGKTKIFEIWDKKKRMVYELANGEKKPLRVRKDPLRLKGFYDCHKPMVANMRSDKYLPMAEFKQIHNQLNTINMLESRICALTKSIKAAGFHSADVPELKSLQNAKDGELKPIKDLQAVLGEAGGMDKVIAWWPIEKQAQVVAVLEQQKKDAKEQIYEITGLSDIVRGATKASETATAQQIKGQWASVRLQKKQLTINMWLRGIMRMYAEIIAEHFTPQQLQLMTGIEVTDEMMQTMRSDVLRCYSIDVETDSTIQADESQDKQDRMEMINTVLPLLQSVIPAIQQNMLPADLGKELLITAVKGYKHARGLEDMVVGLGDNMAQLSQLQQQLQQGQQQMQQMDMNYQQQLQQANQMVAQLQKQLADVNMRKENRDDMDKQAEVAKDMADVEKKKAETAQIWQNIAQPENIGMDAYRI